MPSEESEATPKRAENTWAPILLAFAVLIFSTVVVVAASLYFRDDPPGEAAPGVSGSPSASATPTARG